MASEQQRADVAEARARFQREMAAVDPTDLVFVDESGVTTKRTPHYGRAPKGERVIDRVPHGHWKVLTVLGALGRTGVLAAMTVDAATDADVFCAYVGQVPCPRLRAGQVVVMDNLSAHKVSAVREQIEAAGCRRLYLPPYSPDLNPIESAWSQMKAWLRAAQLRAVADLEQVVGQALASITEQDAGGYFQALRLCPIAAWEVL